MSGRQGEGLSARQVSPVTGRSSGDGSGDQTLDQRPEADQEDDDGGIDLDEDDFYVQELKKVFLSCCASSSDERLDRAGVSDLCTKLQLVPYRELVIDRVFAQPPVPYETPQRVSFPIFKRRFVQLLPEIVDLGSVGPSGEQQEAHVRSTGATDFNEELRSLPPTTSSTANNDDVGGYDLITTRRARAIERTIRELEVGVDGFIDRYDARLVCQNSISLSHLSPTRTDTVFDSLCAHNSNTIDQSGRMPVNVFVNGFTAAVSDQGLLVPVVASTNETSYVSRGADGEELNLFEALDVDNTGIVSMTDIAQLWSRFGMDAQTSQQALAQIGFAMDAEVGASTVSSLLDSHLVDFAKRSDVVTAAVVSYKALIDFMKTNLIDLRCRCEHHQRELGLAARRRQLLIDEFDASQKTIEQTAEIRISELEDRYKQRIAQLEERHSTEKGYLSGQLQLCEQQLKESRENEAVFRSRSTNNERECNRLRRESQDMTQTVQEMEQLNRDLRHELQKSTFFARKAFGQNLEQRASGGGAASPRDAGMWKHKAELLAAQNKRLKDRVDELVAAAERRQQYSNGGSASVGRALHSGPSTATRGLPTQHQQHGQRKRTAAAGVTPLYARNSTAFRNQLMIIRRRRRMHQDKGTLSEMDSEPEPIFLRPRRKRPLTVKQRLQRCEQRMKRLGYDPLPASSTSETGAGSKMREPGFGVALIRRGSRQHDSVLRSGHSSSRDEQQKMYEVAKKQFDEALKLKERELTEKSQREKREMEIRFASEKNAMERAFTEEKMTLMSKLQEDFEMELRRARMQSSSVESVSHSSHSNSTTTGHVDKMTKQIKMLESSLEGQRNGYETKMDQIKRHYERTLADVQGKLGEQQQQQQKQQQQQQQETTDHSKTVVELPETLSQQLPAIVLENERGRGPASVDARKGVDELSRRLQQSTTRCLQLEADQQRTNKQLAELRKADAYHKVQFAQLRAGSSNKVSTAQTQTDLSNCEVMSGSSSNNNNNNNNNSDSVRLLRCSKCDLVDSRIRDLELVVQKEVSTESGIEDLCSSAESLEDANMLKRENHKLRRKLALARERLTDLRLCMAVTGSQEIRKRCSLANNHSDSSNKVYSHSLSFHGGNEWDSPAMNAYHRSATAVTYCETPKITNDEVTASELERLAVQNMVLETKLAETEQLLQSTVTKYQNQCRETGRLGELLRQYCSTTTTAHCDAKFKQN